MTRTVLGRCSLVLATMAYLAAVPSLAFAQKLGLDASARKPDVASAQKRASVQKWEYRDLLKTIEIKSPPVRSPQTQPADTNNADTKPAPTNHDQLQLTGSL